MEIRNIRVANAVTRKADIHLMAITANFMESKLRLPRNHSKCKTSLFPKPTMKILQKVSFNMASLWEELTNLVHNLMTMVKLALFGLTNTDKVTRFTGAKMIRS
tara:strand:+ start:6781 stop:7092 length:312 start_codon:yes stop_codon:yes gene_type:complete